MTSLAQCRGFGPFTHTGWQKTPVCNLLTGQVTLTISQRARALFDLLRSTWKEYERDYARYFAVAMVYYALMSLVPLLLLMLATLGLLLRFTDLATVAEEQLLRYVESSFGLQIRATLGQLLERLEQESVIVTWVSLIGLIMTASVLFRHLRLSFRAIWKHAPPLVSGPVRVVMRATFREQVIAYAMVLSGGALLLVAVVLIGVIQWMSGLFNEAGPLNLTTTKWLLGLPSPLILVALTFALLFKTLPPARLEWRHVWLAAALCAAAWFVAAEALTLYGLFFGTNKSAYGAIGGLLMIMIWMNIVSQVLFFGGELCKVIAQSEQVGVEDVAGPRDSREARPLNSARIPVP